MLTGIILVVFILFPITPSEKVLASIGRENVANSNKDNQVTTTVMAATTKKSTTTETETTTTTTSVSTTTKTVNIRITSGSGFLWNGRIPTGVEPNVPTTPVQTPETPTVDPGLTGGTDIPQDTTPVTPPQGTDIPSTPVDPDPNGGTVTPPPADTPSTPPPADIPSETPPPVETPPPAETPPADSGNISE